jgi:hypothetical protein
MQSSSNRPLSKAKEKEKKERGLRYRLISDAREGSDEAKAKLRDKHGITKVWSQEEIEAYEAKS